jgi:hypothetical protein
MSVLYRHVPSVLRAASVAILMPFLEGCVPSYPSVATSTTTINAPTHQAEPPISGATEGNSTISCPALMRKKIEHLHTYTERVNASTEYLWSRNAKNPHYEAELIALSNDLAKIDQDLLSYCRDQLDRELEESILSDLADELANAGRATDALLVANECSKRFPDSPYCVAAGANASHKLGMNSNARAAAERVIRRGPYDAKMEATIANMRALLGLISAEQQR